MKPNVSELQRKIDAVDWENVNWALLELHEALETRKNISDFIDEFDLQAFRSDQAVERKKEVESDLIEFWKWNEQQISSDQPPFARILAFRVRGIEELQRELSRMHWKERSCGNNGNQISNLDIARAKEFPFDRLIELKRNYALCPFHPDRHPSLYVKNNFAYCFSQCKRSWDTIAFLMERDSLSFVDAVRRLQ